MPRHKQPEELAKLKGAHKKNPQRYKKKTPKNPMILGQPPKHLSAKAKQIWFEIEAFCLPDTLTASERIIFEILCNLFCEYRAKPLEFHNSKMTQLLNCLAKLGLSPTDRQKLGVKNAEKPEDDFKEFIQ